MKTTAFAARIAAVLLCCLLWSSLQADVYWQELAEPGDFAAGVCDKTHISMEMGGVALSRSLNCVPFLWAPSPEQGIVSKIDARSGSEMARYAMGPGSAPWIPYSVAIDSDGNAYVACAADTCAKIVKINASSSNKSVLGAAEKTSFDVNANGKPKALSWGSDSRVSVVADIGSRTTKPTSLVFDDSGILWVSLWGEQFVTAVDIDEGAVVHSVPVAGQPDSMIAGPNGALWVLCGDMNRLCKIDTMLGKSNGEFTFADQNIRSMCAGREEDTLWVAATSGLICLNIDTGNYTVTKAPGDAALCGVTLDKSGDIWASCESINKIVRFSQKDLTVTASVDVGRGPSSICTDWDGYLWTLDEIGATATRVDPREAKRTATAATGRSPFSSTPFAASVKKPGIIPSGSWRTLVDSRRPGSGWGSIAWDVANSGGHIKVMVRSSDNPMTIQDQQFIPVSNGIGFEVPNGRFLEVQVTFSGGSNTTPILRRMAISGRNLPPDVSKATATNPRLLKLDGSLETVSITGITDPEEHPVKVVITSVTQDEPVRGKKPDAIISDVSEVQLRAKCDPGTEENPGNGRVYIVSFRATDVLGASTSGKVKVTVPPELRWDSVAIEDSKKYDSTKVPEELMASTK